MSTLNEERVLNMERVRKRDRQTDRQKERKRKSQTACIK